jgi:hypothetical protein
VPFDLRQQVRAATRDRRAMGLKDRLFLSLTVLAMLGAVALTGIVLFSD